ncbi:MAG: membrane-bound lytic murein transglycosylase D [Bacteroidia bacterium]|jgi:membrane-bound lytic murein transglycosylase D
MKRLVPCLISAFIILSNPFSVYAEGDSEEKTDTLGAVDVERKVDANSIQKRLYSDDITVFENDELDVDSSTFLTQINALEFRIKMDYNSEIKRFIDYFGVSWQERLKEVITLSEYYFPIYESILDKNGLPLEMKYISVIESALNPYATSRSGAVGCWQFMPYTGKMYDLKIDRYVDERRDVPKATQAACEYFLDMSKKYDDWLVVIASYNCGPGNVNKAIARSGGKTTFWEIYPYLPRQTQNYIPSFIAVAYLMNYYEEHNIFPKWVDTPMESTTAVSCTPTHNLQAIAEVLDLPIASIRTLNPALKTDELPANMSLFNLNLPTDYAYRFIEHESVILALSDSYKARVVEQTYTIKRGDCLGSIANRNGCSVQEIKQWNNLSSSTIHPGQKLKLLL